MVPHSSTLWLLLSVISLANPGPSIDFFGLGLPEDRK